MGIRNELWIVPTVGCVNEVGRTLANAGGGRAPGRRHRHLEGRRHALGALRHEQLGTTCDPTAMAGTCSVDDPFGGYTPGINGKDER